MPPHSRLAIAGVIGVLALTAAFLHAQPATAATQPGGLWLPWEAGQSWRLTNGPHSGGAALDFQPPDAGGKACETFSSAYWVVASAGGTVTSISNGLEIDHGNGLKTGYLHLQEKQMASGRVDAGDRLGKAGCCPEGYSSTCFATAPHLHFYTLYGATARGSRASISKAGSSRTTAAW